MAYKCFDIMALGKIVLGKYRPALFETNTNATFMQVLALKSF